MDYNYRRPHSSLGQLTPPPKKASVLVKICFGMGPNARGLLSPLGDVQESEAISAMINGIEDQKKALQAKDPEIMNSRVHGYGRRL